MSLKTCGRPDPCGPAGRLRCLEFDAGYVPHPLKLSLAPHLLDSAPTLATWFKIQIPHLFPDRHCNTYRTHLHVLGHLASFVLSFLPWYLFVYVVSA